MSYVEPAPAPTRKIGGLAPGWAVGALVLDIVLVFVFAFVGKESHESQSALSLVLTIVWPYVVGVLFGWGIVSSRRGWEVHRMWPAGVTIWLVTYVMGTLLRWGSGRGIAPGFLLVSVIFLGLTLVGWRAVTALVLRLRAQSPAADQG
ncbi:MAG: DUF3054 domain-containing protein [Nocardioides sp.]|nr:DUF3054 domain-containing protein [Nocardioides sp.]